ncbi:uncharacterized protein LOC108161594 [Drosophila miranda]|uniref:uncharacterized protein LOC108161594 n=1 Tax=Drosophila miranda TaxID=7229 RepID=UPI0007E7BF55|nr:uncharacterized protein LOC108161594 [Drosophila miranda]
MKFLLTFIICFWLAPNPPLGSCQTDAYIKLELENIRGFANNNPEFTEWRDRLLDALKPVSEQSKLQILQDFQRWNVQRLDLEKQIFRICEKLQKSIMGKCHETFRKLRDACVWSLTRPNTKKADVINVIKKAKCLGMIRGKEKDYGLDF